MSSIPRPTPGSPVESPVGSPAGSPDVAVGEPWALPSGPSPLILFNQNLSVVNAAPAAKYCEEIATSKRRSLPRLGLLGQARSFFWRREGPPARSGAGSGRARVQSHGQAVYW